VRGDDSGRRIRRGGDAGGNRRMCHFHAAHAVATTGEWMRAGVSKFVQSGARGG
jgi:hypothetical protein